MNVKTTFLNRKLEEHIVMTQLEGFAKIGKEDYLCFPRLWYRRFDDFMVSKGYHRSQYDNYVYYGGSNQGGVVYLLLYVDDILIASKHNMRLTNLSNLNNKFEMKDLGNAKKIL